VYAQSSSLLLCDTWQSNGRGDLELFGKFFFLSGSSQTRMGLDARLGKYLGGLDGRSQSPAATELEHLQLSIDKD
jgi:hypothetical protein